MVYFTSSKARFTRGHARKSCKPLENMVFARCLYDVCSSGENRFVVVSFAIGAFVTSTCEAGAMRVEKDRFYTE